MKFNFQLKSKQGAGLVAGALVLIGLILFSFTQRSVVTVKAEVDSELLVTKPAANLTLPNGTVIKDVGFNPTVLKEVVTPDSGKIIFISSVHCNACDVDPNLVVYQLGSDKKVSLDLPGTYTAHSDDQNTNGSLDPYMHVHIFYGLCGQQKFGIWSFSQSTDDEIYKRVSVEVQASDLTLKMDKLSPQDYKAETTKYSALRNCDKVPEQNFETM